MAIYALLPAAVALIAAALGRAARHADERWASLRLLVPAATMAALAGGVAVTLIDPEVGSGDVVAGVLLAAILLGAAPVVAFYTVGYLIRHGWLAVLVVVATAVPFVLYVLFGWLVVVGLVNCPPDAYECPI